MLGSQAAAGAHHGAMGLRVLQGVGLGMVQRWLWMWMWVLELKLGFELLLLLLVHTGRPIMRKRLWGEVTISWDPFELCSVDFQSLCGLVILISVCACICLAAFLCV